MYLKLNFSRAFYFERIGVGAGGRGGLTEMEVSEPVMLDLVLRDLRCPCPCDSVLDQ